ncbi:DEAD/DEAH box helicase [Levilactobacillus bambusae]|uniref:DEAD-box ATP-dependent RNA helicase CshB n=1 Tax=Levilactobacillus bambusae TaxID=2024736 RepID=A0A2V1MZK2_9LACO|nr:DEAD/DEAH box helicase [Levilactobacillus bambusae]PWF99584.1 DEAD/DEAH box helicase [Levilactobacillus bambusae]
MSDNFAQFNLKPWLLDAVKELGFQEPTPVQKKLIPVISHNSSVIGQSQTGSGKTHTFLLPIFNELTAKPEVQAVITTPSRELAYQIYDAAKQLAKHAPFEIRVHNYVGGTDKTRQVEKLKNNQPQIVVGTPGRIWDLVRSNALDIHTARQFVVDEADMTLDLGFLDQVDHIAGRMPEDLQMMVFSATIPQKLQPFLKKYMKNPVVEKIPVTTVISPTIENWLISTKGKNKNQLIYDLLTVGNPYLALVFANTKERVEEINAFLQGQGLKVAMIHGGIKARERKRVMRDVKNLDYQFVVATDLAARGIDIEGVSLVINDDIPSDLEFFVHRVGRTGRKGMAGTAITLYAPDEEDEIAAIENMGVTFQPKKLVNQEIVDSYDRNRRENRTHHQKKLDPELIGKVKKEKKKIKPGYKNRIKKAISDKRRKERRIEQRTERRSKKRAKKQSSQRFHN